MTGRPARILCLDDQPSALRVRKALLEQFGCEVQTVLDPQSCLMAAAESAFDVAVIDYHLGGTITGEDVARDMRVCAPGTALVMLTGDPKVPSSARESVDAVIIKGAGCPEDLFFIIEELAPECALKPRRQPFNIGLIAQNDRPE